MKKTAFTLVTAMCLYAIFALGTPPALAVLLSAGSMLGGGIGLLVITAVWVLKRGRILR